ncbi:hypothetical protein ACFO9E_03620 [Streptomyces maoxianensis]|uniref:MFS transporter n=1 Tax=Streptomyces maoxianensis TaxID=1459942 RepID=A0ABV9G0C3_9ACTN
MTTDALTPTGRTSEAYAWLILAIGAGQAAGAAFAVLLLAHPGHAPAECGRRHCPRAAPPARA